MASYPQNNAGSWIVGQQENEECIPVLSGLPINRHRAKLGRKGMSV